MTTEFFALNKFIQQNKLKDKQDISKEELTSFLMLETKKSISTIRNAIYFFISLGFLEKKDRTTFKFNKIKFDEFMRSDSQ